MTRPPSRRAPLSRAVVVVRLSARLRRHGWPRVQMSIMVALTGLAGWLLSAAMVHLGLHSMTLRWPLALLGAWGVFLAMLGLWVRVQRDGLGEVADAVDVADAVTDVSWSGGGGGSGGSGTVFSGGGGRFGGSGASGMFETPAQPGLSGVQGLAGRLDAAMSDTDLGIAGARGGGSGLGIDLPDLGDADDLLVPILVIALAVGMAAASLYVVWVAPTLLAELLFDGAISYGLYRRLRTDAPRAWLGTAVRRTALPFVLTAILLTGAGWALHELRPGAWTIGEALHPARIPDGR